TCATPRSTGARRTTTSRDTPRSSASGRRSRRPDRRPDASAPRRRGRARAPAASKRLLELVEDRRILERRHVLLDLLALGDGAQQAAHDLARARLGQVVAEADVLGLRYGTDLLADPVAQLLGDLVGFRAFGPRALQHDERAYRLAGEVVGTTDHRRFGNHLVGDQRGFDLHRAQAMARDVQHVVDPAHDREITRRAVADRAVAGEIELAAELRGEIAVAEALGIAPDRANHGRPRTLD